MDKQFWISIKENNFAIPGEHAVQPLTEELFSCIGSTDPELRDTIGLEAFYNWLTLGLYNARDLRGFILRLVANLEKGIGELESDSVFLRSFSALWLVNIVSFNNEKQILEKEDIQPVLAAALDYFLAERDLRGKIPVKGWAHAIAHAADLLCALAVNLHTGAEDHLKILDCIAVKLRSDQTPQLQSKN